MASFQLKNRRVSAPPAGKSFFINGILLSTAPDASITLIVQNLTQALSLDSPTLEQQAVLAAANIGLAQSLSEPTFTQQHILNIADLTLAQTVSVPVFTQAGTLALADLAQAMALGEPTFQVVQNYSVQRDPTSTLSSTGTWDSTDFGVVNDYPDTTTYLTNGTAAGDIRFEYTDFAVPAGATITDIRVRYYAAKTGSPSTSGTARLIVGGTAYDSTTDNFINGTMTNYEKIWTTNPKSATAWIVDDVNGIGANALQQFGFVSTDASPTIRLASIQLEVNYSISGNLLELQNLDLTQSTTSPDFTQAGTLTPNNLAIIQALQFVDFIQQHTLALDNLAQALSLPNLDLAQDYALTANDLTQTASLSAVTFGVGSDLTPDNLFKAISIGQPSFTQAGTLTVATLQQTQVLNLPNLTQANILVVDGLSTGQSLTNVTVSVQAYLIAQNLAQAASLTSPSFTQQYVLVTDNLALAQSIAQAELTQNFNLTVQSLTLSEILSSPNVALGTLFIIEHAEVYVKGSDRVYYIVAANPTTTVSA